jgi:hypothetical protein
MPPSPFSPSFIEVDRERREARLNRPIAHRLCHLAESRQVLIVHLSEAFAQLIEVK